MQTFLRLALIVAVVLLFVFGVMHTAWAQSIPTISPFFWSGAGYAQLASSTASIRVPGLAGLSCIGTNGSGVFQSGTCGAGGGAWPWTTVTNYSTSTNATTTPTWYKMGVHASSTSQFVNATTSLLTIGTKMFLGSASYWVETGSAAEFYTEKGGSNFDIFIQDGNTAFSITDGSTGGALNFAAASPSNVFSFSGNGNFYLQNNPSALTANRLISWANLAGSPALGSYTTGFHDGFIPFGASGLLATSSAITFSSAGARLTATNASTTVLSATTLCLTGDACRTSWPSAPALTSHTNIVYVGKWGSDANDGLTPNTPKLTLNAATTSATSGTLIYVYPGYYNETGIRLPNGVSLMGSDASSTIIYGTPADGHGVVESRGVNSISNITLNDTADVNVNILTAGIQQVVPNTDLTLDNVFVHGGYDGIIADATSNATTTIRNSVITADYDGVAIYTPGAKLFVYNSRIDVTGKIGGASTIFVRGIALVDQVAPSLYIENSRINVTRVNATAPIAGIWLGRQSALVGDGNGNATSSNTYITVLASSTIAATGYMIQQSATSSNLFVTGGHVETCCTSTSRDLENNGGRIVLGAGVDFSIASGTISYHNVTFGNASSTMLSATTLCLTGDSCKTTWPSGGGVWPFTTGLSNFGTTTQATTTAEWFQMGLHASSTSQLVDVNIWNALRLTATSSSILATDHNGYVMASTSIGWNLLKGPASSIFAFNESGAPIATTSVNAAYVSGSLGTVNGTAFNRGSSISINALPWTSALNNFATTTPATSTPFSFQGGVYASSTSQFVNLNVWNALRLTSTSSALLATDQNGYVVSTSTISANLLSTVPIAKGGTNATAFNSHMLIAYDGASFVATSTPTMAQLFATSTTLASTLPLASTTAVTATTLCLTGDTCRTTWPTSSALGYTAWGGSKTTSFATSTVASTTAAWFQMGLHASSTSELVNLNIWNALRLTSTTSAILATDHNGYVLASTTIGWNLLKGPASSIFSFNENGVPTATTSIGWNYIKGPLSSIFAFNESGTPVATSTIGWNYIKGSPSSIFAFDSSGVAVATSAINVGYLTGTLPIAKGGTGASSIGTHMLVAMNGSSLVSTSTPTAAAYLATSTTATSSLPTLSVSTKLIIPNGTAPAFGAIGVLVLDTTSNNLIMASSTTGHFVVASATTTLYSFSVASTSARFASGGFIEMPANPLAQVVTAVWCKAVGGTSKVITLSDDGTNDTNAITCTTTGTQFALTSNNSFTAYESIRTEMGATTGTVDEVVIRYMGYKTSD